jgi:PEP-CTERM motif
MKIKIFAVTGILVCGFWAAAASAGITFLLGNHPQPDEANILFSSSETGATIVGEVDHTGVDAIFSSLTGETLLQKAKGQADIFNSAICAPPPNHNCDLTSMSFSLESGFGFLDFILNLENGSGTATVTVLSQNAVFQYVLGNGQNFLTIVADGGDVMTGIEVTMSAGGGFGQFKQPRVSGVCELGTETCVPITIVPEPGALVLFGIALLAMAGIRRRRL